MSLKKVYKGDLTVADAVSLSRKEIDCFFDSSRGINLQKVAKNLEIIGKCPKCGGNVVVKSKGFFCDNRECRFTLWNTMKYYGNSVRITMGKAKTLIEGKHAPFKLKSKAGKEYKAYLKIVIKGDYVNLEHDGFVD